MAKSKAKMHTVIRNRFVDLIENAKKQGDAGKGTGRRPWQVPSDLETGLDEIDKLHEPAFNRDDANTNYQEAVQSGGEDAGTLADAISLKQQIAYNAAEERAFRLRHASSVRRGIHAINARDGHGNSKGVFGGVQKQMEDAISSGANAET